MTQYGKFYATSGYAAFPQEHRHAVGKLPFSMIMVDQQPHSFSDPSVSETILALPLTASERCAWSWNMDDGGWQREEVTPGKLLLLPANVSSRWEVTGSRRLLALIIPLETMRQALGPHLPARVSEAFRPLAQASWEDAFINGVMARLWEGVKGARSIDRLIVDSLLVSVVAHLLQRAGARHDLSTIALPRWRLRRVMEHSEVHLHKPIQLNELAEVAGLSPRHFARAFRQETGETPHRWLMNRRIMKAKHLLSSSDLSINNVSTACGFASQAHLTKIFRRAAGTTPLRWKNEHKGEVSAYQACM
jgi:AraC family transcriptional regulator